VVPGSQQAAPGGSVWRCSGWRPDDVAGSKFFTNGAWFGGSPYLGPNATVRAVGPTGTTPPSGTIANSPTGEAGFAFMWTPTTSARSRTNNIFPGGMLMMIWSIHVNS